MSKTYTSGQILRIAVRYHRRYGKFIGFYGKGSVMHRLERKHGKMKRENHKYIFG